MKLKKKINFTKESLTKKLAKKKNFETCKFKNIEGIFFLKKDNLQVFN
jgi:hypothetical protein